MADVGYSGTPLIKKLGIKPAMKVLLINAPGNYFEMIAANISKQLVAGNETPDLIHLFAANNAIAFDTETIPAFTSLRVQPVGPQHFKVTVNVPLPV